VNDHFASENGILRNALVFLTVLLALRVLLGF
jgi:hypothetical protein